MPCLMHWGHLSERKEWVQSGDVPHMWAVERGFSGLRTVCRVDSVGLWGHGRTRLSKRRKNQRQHGVLHCFGPTWLTLGRHDIPWLPGAGLVLGSTQSRHLHGVVWPSSPW